MSTRSNEWVFPEQKSNFNDSTYFVSTSSSESSPNWRVLVLRHDDYRKPFQTWSDSFPHMGQSPSPTISDNLVQVSVGWFKICGIHLKLSSSPSVLSSSSYWNSSIASGLWFNIEQWQTKMWFQIIYLEEATMSASSMRDASPASASMLEVKCKVRSSVPRYPKVKWGWS